MNEMDKLIALVRETSPELLKQAAGASALSAALCSIALFILLIVPVYFFFMALKDSDQDSMDLGFPAGVISAILLICILLSIFTTIIRVLYPIPAAVRYLLR